ncbi:Amine oxidase [Cordyceps fumosorosea ARSEF 2679]|uniref:Amine oxidase n=1 Tax=Cordyceps fumosorosea (strain ARSEF 2679) TaxID=1081104 RepID=A0A167V2B4_CORFA|nr:Amine oxidase [Cordyceps fumosorosea ARSEF 2679]OAA62153.1 Amine oxidase [Cordyceps fumosorosea ARSEF 2679]
MPLHRDSLIATQPRAADVIIVGAGVSGLQAALKLQQSGAFCLVLEESGRVGSQAFTNGTFHLEHHPRTYALAVELGILDEPHPAQGKAVLEGFAAFDHHEQPALNAEDAASLLQIKAILDTLSLRNDTPPTDVTVEQLVDSYGATEVVARMANLWTRTIFGLSSHNVSVAQFLSHCASCGGLLAVLDTINGLSDDDADHFAITGGSNQIATALSQRLSPGTVQLRQKVTHIEHGANGCTLYAESGATFRATKVVLAGALSMCSAIQITPGIAAATVWEAARDEQGFSTTVDVLFDHPWWQRRGLSGHAQGLTGGPITQVRPSCRTDIDSPGLYALSCQVSGEQARGMWLWLMSAEERETLIAQHLGAIFGGDVPRAVQVVEADEDPLVGGQRSLNVAAAAGGNAEGGVHFAGAAASSVWRGHVEGALAAGEGVAIEVLGALGSLGGIQMMAPRL